MLRLEHTADKEKIKFESSWEQTRTLWATILNVNGNKAKPTDLIRLSYDKKKVEHKPGEVAKKFKPKK